MQRGAESELEAAPGLKSQGLGPRAGAVSGRGLDARRFGPAWIVLAAVTAAYANAMTASFQFDDFDVIVRDPRVQDLHAWWASMPGIRPLLKLSYALNHASGAGVVGFHLFNVVIHAVNGLLVLDLVHERAAASGLASDDARRLALATALLFVLHPVQTEAVTYASGRSASLSTGFALASIVVWSNGHARAGKLAQSVVSPLLMVLGLLVKESAVVVPAILVLWRALDCDRPVGLAALVRATRVHWIVLLGMALAGSMLPAYRRFFATSFATRSPAENLVAQVDGVVYLLGQTVRIDRLNADPALRVGTSMDAATLSWGAALLGLLVCAFVASRRCPLPSFAVLWTAIWLLPTNSLVARLDLVNDRQLYGALMGPALLAVLGFASLGRMGSAAHSGAIRVAFVVLLVVLGMATHRRNALYRDEVAFWRDVVAKSPVNARAYNNLGIALAERCDAEGAERAFRAAIALEPDFVRPAVNLRLLREGHAFAEGCRSSNDRRPPHRSARRRSAVDRKWRLGFLFRFGGSRLDQPSSRR